MTKEIRQKIYNNIMVAVLLVCMLIGLMVCGLLTSCKSHEPTIVERVRTDTVRITQQQRDSIYLRDSIFVNQWQSGDTIFQVRDRWHTQYVKKEVRDTFYKAKVDSVPVPYPVIAISCYKEGAGGAHMVAAVPLAFGEHRAVGNTDYRPVVGGKES